ncbi:Uncharacterized protein APZ42_012916 [Daphnia magna]|uniref:Endonuclease/exonuclease/phosphatase domain-containing protein n=1 Tax=Daphnia magna TaxID=35525 RepID=A0A162RCL6_9CRUS|nr:Uncharacterized protein APZ42_012916 [Daphnia magna]
MGNYITQHAGEPNDSTVLTGGDLAVYAHNGDQQTSLLSLKQLMNRPVICSLPLSSINNRVGVIFVVPMNDTIEDLQEALADQNVTHVKRLPMRRNTEVPSETVLLAFSTPLPTSVKVQQAGTNNHQHDGTLQTKVSYPNNNPGASRGLPLNSKLPKLATRTPTSTATGEPHAQRPALNMGKFIDGRIHIQYMDAANMTKVVLLSETHWNSGFSPKFKHHHILKKDCLNRLGGGVTILIRKTLHFTAIHLHTRDTVEAIGASIICTNKKQIDFISTCVPKGDCKTEDIRYILSRENDFVVGGDFNGHHSLWETAANENKPGKAIHKALANIDNACLITPTNLNDRIEPGTGKSSTIDLTFTSSTPATFATTVSDHMPVIFTLNASSSRSSSRFATWMMNEDKWPSWNQYMDGLLVKHNFTAITDPETAFKTFMDSINKSNIKYFKKTDPTRRPESCKDPARP